MISSSNRNCLKNLLVLVGSVPQEQNQLRFFQFHLHVLFSDSSLSVQILWKALQTGCRDKVACKYGHLSSLPHRLNLYHHGIQNRILLHLPQTFLCTHRRFECERQCALPCHSHPEPCHLCYLFPHGPKSRRGHVGNQQLSIYFLHFHHLPL